MKTHQDAMLPSHLNLTDAVRVDVAVECYGCEKTRQKNVSEYHR